MTLRSMAIVIGVAGVAPVLAARFPTNNDPTRQIRFNTADEAEARRAKLINFIWEGGLPADKPTVSEKVDFPSMAVGIDPGNVASVDQLDVDVSHWGFHSIAYLMHPKNTANADRVVLVHQGHGHNLEAGVGSTANHFLANGFTVVAMKMPLFGWAKDKDADIPGQGKVHYNSHDAMVTKTGPAQGGMGFRLFLEPIVQVINHVMSNPKVQEVDLVGLSGGGWTTSMMAAIDKRIRLSVPIAGSAPLSRRNEDPAAAGDTEQFFAPLYDEDIKADGTGGGVATWLEIYALGGAGEGRKQVQVTNEFDACCFAGTFPDSYKEIVTDKVRSLGAGQWGYLRDSSHNVHQISNFVMANAIDPLFDIRKPLYPSGLPVIEQFDGASKDLPKGWDLDPQSAQGSSVVEESGSVIIKGTGLASIVRGAPLNPQCCRPLTITLRIGGISADNFGGVFITDEIGPRPHQVGPIVNMSTKEIGINADNGQGFNAGDRLILGRLAAYSGGAATLSLTFDAREFSVELDAGAEGRFASGKHPWSEIPNGFDPANLGPHAQLFIQSTDTNGGAPASMKIDAVEVRGMVPATKPS